LVCGAGGDQSGPIPGTTRSVWQRMLSTDAPVSSHGLHYMTNRPMLASDMTESNTIFSPFRLMNGLFHITPPCKNKTLLTRTIFRLSNDVLGTIVAMYTLFNKDTLQKDTHRTVEWVIMCTKYTPNLWSLLWKKRCPLVTNCHVTNSISQTQWTLFRQSPIHPK
jgi:hypothetical protein